MRYPRHKAIIDFDSFAMRLATFKGFLQSFLCHPAAVASSPMGELMYCDLSNENGNNLRFFIEAPRGLPPDRYRIDDKLLIFIR